MKVWYLICSYVGDGVVFAALVILTSSIKPTTPSLHTHSKTLKADKPPADNKKFRRIRSKPKRTPDINAVWCAKRRAAAVRGASVGLPR